MRIGKAIAAAAFLAALSYAHAVDYKPLFDKPYTNLPALSYGGKKADLKTWGFSEKPLYDNADATAVLQTRTSPDGKFAIEQTLIRYKKYPFVEWKTRVKNPSDEISDLVENIEVFAFRMPNKHEPLRSRNGVRVRYLKGADTSIYEFIEDTYYLENWESYKKFELINENGLGSANHMPYFAMDFSETWGLNVAIGWAGNWKASFDYEETRFIFGAGLPKSKFRLDPKEETSLPSILVMYRKDMKIEPAMNVWRKFILENKTPRENGKPLITPIQTSMGGNATAEYMADAVNRIIREKLPIEMVGIDAGWYGGYHKPKAPGMFGDWGINTGNWDVNTYRHPNGLKPFSDLVRSGGMKFSLWIEIERIERLTPQYEKYSNLILKQHPAKGLLYLGTDEGWKYAFDTLCDIIEKNGVDVWRLDMNLGLNLRKNLEWLDNSRPDRIGLSCAKHTTGLYKLWDELKKKYPNIQFDVCSAGGKRLDYETLSRAFAIWRSDAQCHRDDEVGESSQIQTYYLQSWLPSHSGGNGSQIDDEYKYVSSISSGVMTGLGTLSSDKNVPYVRKYFTLAKRVREYIVHNFYRLTERPEKLDNWCAWQAHDPAKDEGYFIAFRRKLAEDKAIHVRLREIDPKAKYSIEDKNGAVKTVLGEELEEFRIALPPRDYAVYFYKKEK